MVSHIPFELWIAIFDHIKHDKPALAHCSLVCRAFVHECRIRLFRKITVGYDKDRQLCHNISGIASVVSLASLVRALDIEGPGFLAAPLKQWELDKAIQSIPRLPSLKRLSLSTFEWADLTQEARNIILGLLAPASALDINQLEYISDDDVYHLLSSAPSLLAISFKQEESIRGGEESTLHVGIQLPCVQLETLEIEAWFLPVMSNWLHFPIISKLRVHIDYDQNSLIEHVSAFTRRLGHRLEYLSLKYTKASQASETEVEYFDCSANTNLKHLTLEVEAMSAPYYDTEAPSVLYIPTLAPGPLTTLTLAFAGFDPAFLDIATIYEHYTKKNPLRQTKLIIQVTTVKLLDVSAVSMLLREQVSLIVGHDSTSLDLEVQCSDFDQNPR